MTWTDFTCFSSFEKVTKDQSRGRVEGWCCWKCRTPWWLSNIVPYKYILSKSVIWEIITLLLHVNKSPLVLLWMSDFQNVLNSLAQVLQTESYGFLDGVKLSHSWSFSFSCCLQLFHHHYLFQWVHSSHDAPKMWQPQFWHLFPHKLATLWSIF